MADEEKSHLEVAQLTIKALSGKGWANVDPSQVKVKENSGEGGSKCYKVSAPSLPEVALHLRAKEETSDPLSDPRAHHAALVFGEHGFGPKRLAQCEDWFVEPWEGNGQPDIGPHIEKFRELGRFVADYHQKLPTAWYDEWRSKLRERVPALKSSPQGCHVWWWAARPDKWLVGLDSKCLELWASDYFFEPKTEVGRRLVTAHGDLNEGNMLQMGDGFRCIDFEFSCVTNAIQDLSYVVGWITEDTYSKPNTKIEDKAEKKRAFLTSYLEGLGEPSGKKEVDELLIDAEMSWLAHSIHNNGVRPWSMVWNPDGFEKDWELAKKSVNLIRESEELQQKVLQTSFAEVHKELKNK